MITEYNILLNNDNRLLDIIGDVHGCYDELIQLLFKLGYPISSNNSFMEDHPQMRKLVFLGDLVDRGPKILDVLNLVMNLVKRNTAFCILGNHDDKLLRYLKGNDVQINNGLEYTVEQLKIETEIYLENVKAFLDSLPYYYIFDHNKLVVTHAGIKEDMIGLESRKIKNFCMYGETTKEIDEFGFPIRRDWSKQYNGDSKVVYGHTPISSPKMKRNTVNIDTGCVFGGYLSCYRYPEDEIVSVPSKRTYYKMNKPF